MSSGDKMFLLITGALLSMFYIIYFICLYKSNKSKIVGRILFIQDYLLSHKIILAIGLIILSFCLLSIFNWKTHSCNYYISEMMMITSVFGFFNGVRRTVLTSEGIAYKFIYGGIYRFERWSDIVEWRWEGKNNNVLVIKGKNILYKVKIPLNQLEIINKILLEAKNVVQKPYVS